MRTREECLQGLRKMKRNLSRNGEKIGRDDPGQIDPVLKKAPVFFR
jgi:hypothetical protein